MLKKSINAGYHVVDPLLVKCVCVSKMAAEWIDFTRRALLLRSKEFVLLVCSADCVWVGERIQISEQVKPCRAILHTFTRICTTHTHREN